jgi:hypothetical protein
MNASLLVADSPTLVLENEHKATNHGWVYAAVGLLIGQDCARLRLVTDVQMRKML